MATVRLINPRVTMTKDNKKVVFVGLDVPFGAGKTLRVYKFRPAEGSKGDPDADQFCDVVDPDHLAMFASIPEDFDVTFTAAEKQIRGKVETAGAAIAQKRIDDAAARQKYLDKEARDRQKQAKATRGKKREAEIIGTVDD